MNQTAVMVLAIGMCETLALLVIAATWAAAIHAKLALVDETQMQITAPDLTLPGIEGR